MAWPVSAVGGLLYGPAGSQEVAGAPTRLGDVRCLVTWGLAQRVVAVSLDLSRSNRGKARGPWSHGEPGKICVTAIPSRIAGLAHPDGCR